MNGTKQNLLILAPEYDKYIKGSGEELSKYFNRVYVIIPKWKQLNLIFTKKIIFKNINNNFTTNKKNVNITEVNISVFPLFSYYQILNFIKRNNINFDFILSHFLVPYGYLGYKIAKHLNIESITIIHRFEIYDFALKNYLFRSIFKSIYNKTDKIITVSNANFKMIKQIVRDANKISVIYNGYDKKFKPMDKISCRKTLNLPLDKKIILNVANYLIYHKNQLNLINAADLILMNRNDLLFYLIVFLLVFQNREYQLETNQMLDRHKSELNPFQ